jgi:hypothetical protein
LVKVEGNDNPDPNALAPQTVQIRLKDGQVLDWSCEVMLANPARPLSPEALLAKFSRCWDFAAEPLGETKREALIRMVDRLEDVADIRELVPVLTPGTDAQTGAGGVTDAQILGVAGRDMKHGAARPAAAA